MTANQAFILCLVPFTVVAALRAIHREDPDWWFIAFMSFVTCLILAGGER